MVDNTDYADEWGTESGLIDNLTIRVDKAYFSTDARYNNGETLLLTWEGKIDQPLGEDGSDDFTVSFPTGTGWISEDGGDTAKSEKGRAKFNSSSIYGRVVDAVKTAKADGGLDMMDVVRKRGLPTKAKIWEGLTFRMEQVEWNYGSDIGKKSRLMPVEFLGEGVDPKTGTVGDVPATTAVAESAAASPTVLEARLKAMAKTSDTHAAFVDKALEIPGVSEDATLLERVVDEAGIYAEARA